MHALKVKSLAFGSASRIIVAVVFCLLASLQSPGQNSSADRVVTLVDSFKVRVRSTPQIVDDNILASLFKGTQLPLTGQTDGWYEVILPDGKTGFVHGNYAIEENARDQLEVIYEVVRVRARPSTASDSQAKAIMGQRLHLLEKTDNWYKVQIPKETIGWVRQDMVTFRPVAPSSVAEPETAAQSTNPAKATEEAVAEEEAREAEPAEVEEIVEDSPADQTEKDLPETTSPPPPAPTTRSTAPGSHSLLTEVGADWMTMTILAGLLTLVAIVVFAIFRRRRLSGINQVIQKGRAGISDEERKLVREMKETRNRLDGLDTKLQDRFKEFRASAGDSTQLGSKTSEDMLSSLEELRAVIEDQQKRMDLYSELVSLQNEQIEAFRQENTAIKKLLQLKDKH